MVSLTTIAIAFVVVAIYYFFFKKDGNNLNLPPGPRSLPIVGNMFELMKEFHLQAQKWAGEYGDIYKFRLGSNTMTVVSDPKWVRELFNDTNLTGKPELEIVNLLTNGPRGVINSTGKEWEEQRRFTLRNLRDFGFGKNSLEATIMEEVNDLLENFKSQQGQPINVSRKFSLSVLNSLWQILGSKRYSLDDPTLLKILLDNSELVSRMTKTPLIFLPILSKIIPEWSGFNGIKRLVVDTQQFIRDCAAEHQATFPKDGVHRDFVDCYIDQLKKTTDPESSFYGDLGEKNLLAVITDLFGAGSETTSQTLIYSILMLSKFPQIQKQVQLEMDTTIGRNRQVSLSDRPNLPYCMATFEEVLRYHSMVPMGSIRTTLKDMKFNSYDLPKGTWVVANFFGIHYNEKYFPNPKKFDPTRYISKDGTFKKNENVMAFSYGRRGCLGESLARDEYFLFFTNLFQKFNIRLAPNSLDVSTEAEPGVVLQARPFEVIMEERD